MSGEEAESEFELSEGALEDEPLHTGEWRSGAWADALAPVVAGMAAAAPRCPVCGSDWRVYATGPGTVRLDEGAVTEVFVLEMVCRDTADASEAGHERPVEEHDATYLVAPDGQIVGRAEYDRGVYLDADEVAALAALLQAERESTEATLRGILAAEEPDQR